MSSSSAPNIANFHASLVTPLGDARQVGHRRVQRAVPQLFRQPRRDELAVGLVARAGPVALLVGRRLGLRRVREPLALHPAGHASHSPLLHLTAL